MRGRERLEKSCKEIYPLELKLKKKNIGYSKGSSLDLGIQIENNKFNIQVYDKRDVFSFSIIRISYLTSNVPSKLFYSAFGAKILL